jgi:tetratricopeptide (TPR) repeat protein
MNIKNSLALVFPGVFQMRQGRSPKGIALTSVFAFSIVLYAALSWAGREGSLFAYLALSTALLSLWDALGTGVSGPLQENLAANPYEDGRIAMMTRDYARAEALFLRAYEDDPEDMDVVFQLAVLLHKKGDDASARKWLRKYLKQKRHTQWLADAEKLFGDLNA